MSGWHKAAARSSGSSTSAPSRSCPRRSGPRPPRWPGLTSAATLAPTDPDSAYVLAYDAARQAGTALLSAQGLRATASGGHVAVERVLLAQFAPGFADFHLLRRRRHELEYPDPRRPDNADAGEAEEAITAATEIVAQADGLLTQLQAF